MSIRAEAESRSAIVGETSSPHTQTPLEIALETLAWAAAEHQAWREAIPASRPLARALAEAATKRPWGGTWGTSQLAKLAGCSLDTIQKAFKGERREHGLLGVPGLEPVMWGKRRVGGQGRGNQTEVLVLPRTPLPACLSRENQNSSDCMAGEKLKIPAFKKEKPSNSGVEVENRIISALPCTSTGFSETTSLQSQPVSQDKTGLAGGEGNPMSPQRKEILEALLDRGVRPADAERAARETRLVNSPERLRVVQDGLDVLLAELATDKKITHAATILALRVESSEAYGLILGLQGKVQGFDREPVAPIRPAVPAPRVVQPECAPEALGAWHAVRNALRESLPESTFREWIGPLICLGYRSECEARVLLVGGVSQVHRRWVEESLGDEWQSAFGAAGLPGLCIEFEEVANKKVL